MGVNMIAKNIELDLDAMSVTLTALSQYEEKISKIIDNLKLRLNAADSTSEIRDIQSDMRKAVNIVRNIQKSKESISNSEKNML
tara:strand:- start:359 stop:610 length:252 start_codon:yes stop_codon:yes gene_type:complete